MSKMGIDKKSIFAPDQIYVAVEQAVSTTYQVHVDEEIGDADYYRNLFSILENASPNDTIAFRLNTPGGLLDTALPIINLIRQTEAHTVAIIEGTVASAGTFFVMACDSVIAMPHSCLMIHPASYGSGGDMKSVKRAVEFNDRRLQRIIDDIYEGFLTPEEIKNMVENSEEIWLTAEEVIERLNSRDATFQEAILLEDGESLGDAIEQTIEDAQIKTKSKRKPKKVLIDEETGED